MVDLSGIEPLAFSLRMRKPKKD